MSETVYSYSFQDLFSLLGTWFTVTLKDETEYEGYLYTVDPETKHIVLYKNNRIMILFHSAIEDITLDKEKRMEIKEMDDKLIKDEFKLRNLEERRLELLEFFEKNRVPIECKEKEIHVFSAKIEAPYVSTSVICENSLIRKRVRDLMIDFDRLFSRKE